MFFYNISVNQFTFHNVITLAVTLEYPNRETEKDKKRKIENKRRGKE